jgi:excisionase family DNA binding protein
MNVENDAKHDHRADEDIDNLLTLREVAELLRIPEATLRYWRVSHTGPNSFKIGRHVRYQRREVQTWLRGRLNTEGADIA